MDRKRRILLRGARRAQREIERYKRTQKEIEMLDEDFMPNDFTDKRRYKK